MLTQTYKPIFAYTELFLVHYCALFLCWIFWVNTTRIKTLHTISIWGSTHHLITVSFAISRYMSPTQFGWGSPGGVGPETKEEIPKLALREMCLVLKPRNSDWDSNPWSFNWDRTWSQDLMKLRLLTSHRIKNSVREKLTAKWIYLKRLISFRIDRFDLLAVQGTLKNLLQHQNVKALIL